MRKGIKYIFIIIIIIIINITAEAQPSSLKAFGFTNIFGEIGSAQSNLKIAGGITAAGSSSNTVTILNAGFLSSFLFSNLPSFAGDNNEIPGTYNLYQNYPNPFNPSTKIKFDLPYSSHVKIELYNLIGERVKIILDETKDAGSYTIDFDAHNLNSGFYLYRIQAGKFKAVKKMLLIK